jgi:hypothetical protein
MSNYDNKNRGQIWPNDKKEKDTQPDFKGSVNVEGVEYWVSAWKRRPDANPKAPSLTFSVQAKDAVHERGMAQARQTMADPATAGGQDDFDDDIPF